MRIERSSQSFKELQASKERLEQIIGKRKELIQILDERTSNPGLKNLSNVEKIGELIPRLDSSMVRINDSLKNINSQIDPTTLMENAQAHLDEVALRRGQLDRIIEGVNSGTMRIRPEVIEMHQGELEDLGRLPEKDEKLQKGIDLLRDREAQSKNKEPEATESVSPVDLEEGTEITPQAQTAPVETSKSKEKTLPNILVDEAKHELTIDGRVIVFKQGTIDWKILTHLLNNPRRNIKQEILHKIAIKAGSKSDFPVAGSIYSLRNRIEINPKNSQIITSIVRARKSIYKLNANVEFVHKDVPHPTPVIEASEPEAIGTTEASIPEITLKVDSEETQTPEVINESIIGNQEAAALALLIQRRSAFLEKFGLAPLDEDIVKQICAQVNKDKPISKSEFTTMIEKTLKQILEVVKSDEQTEFYNKQSDGVKLLLAYFGDLNPNKQADLIEELLLTPIAIEGNYDRHGRVQDFWKTIEIKEVKTTIDPTAQSKAHETKSEPTAVIETTTPEVPENADTEEEYTIKDLSSLLDYLPIQVLRTRIDYAMKLDASIKPKKKAGKGMTLHFSKEDVDKLLDNKYITRELPESTKGVTQSPTTVTSEAGSTPVSSPTAAESLIINGDKPQEKLSIERKDPNIRANISSIIDDIIKKGIFDQTTAIGVIPTMFPKIRATIAKAAIEKKYISSARARDGHPLLSAHDIATLLYRFQCDNNLTKRHTNELYRLIQEEIGRRKPKKNDKK